MPYRTYSSICFCLLSCSLASLAVGQTASQIGPFAAPQAFDGTPFGVLSAEIPLPPNLAQSGSLPPRILVEDSAGRIFYPVVSIRSVEANEELRPPAFGRPGRLLDRVRQAVRGESQKRTVPVSIQVLALYRGAGPIEFSLSGDVSQRIRIEPQTDLVGTSYAPLLSRWWSEYTQSAAAAIASDDFPKLVHKALVSMLARRLDLPQVDLDPPDPQDKEASQPLKTLALLGGIEPMRNEILDDVLDFAGESGEANLAVPPEPVWELAPLPPVQADVAIETLATRVPPECFYLRFGAFANYVWFQELAQRYGGEIAQSVLLRGVNYQANAKIERMLAAKLTTIAKMFGDKIIGDMAVFGSDLYLQEGASLGVLFLSTNPDILKSAIEGDRRAVIAKNPTATLSEVMVAGKSVSLLSTPDNRIRSFFVVDGPYVVVSTSETLVRRFLEVGGGGPSLADSPSFRWARTWMPAANDYAVFAYFSPEFFHRLVSPQYQIELRRRLTAIAHLEIAEVAQRVALAEGLGDLDVAEMKAAGLVPAWFDQRVDGARALRSKDGWLDSLRGARGSFLPISDAPLTAASGREVAGYAAIADFYRQEWGHMDPLLLGLRRFRAEGAKTEQVAVEAYIAPFEAEKYGWIAQQLGPPTPIELQLPADDVASLQVHIQGSTTLGISSDNYHLFGGVKDMIPPDPEDTKGLIKTLQALQATPAYIGGWPRPGIIEQLPLGLGLAQPDYAGFARLLGGLWKWSNGEFSLLSFDRSILEQAIPQISPLETNDWAQARLRVANLTGSQMATWINRQWYDRGWRSSHGNAKLLDTVHQQLKVPADQCLIATERLLDAKIQCPLGGEYQFLPMSGGAGGWWMSSAWQESLAGPKGTPYPPPNYSAPWIDWFRGGKVHVTQGPDSLSVVGSIELEMQPLPVDLSPALPGRLPTLNFDIFSLPGKLFGGLGGSSVAPPKPATKSF